MATYFKELEGNGERSDLSDAKPKMAMYFRELEANSEGSESPLRVAPNSRFQSHDQSKPKIIVIDSRVLICECLRRCLDSILGFGSTITFANLSELLGAKEICQSASVVLLCLDSARPIEVHLKRIDQERSELAESMELPPFVYLSEREDIGTIVHALESGARGYIPTSVTLQVAVEAMKLVDAGGSFVPASSLVLAHDALKKSKEGASSPLAELFTERQAAIVEAVRQGKANKAIAYELNMHESTVKVHIRNIMRKLNARNRTQIAFLTERMFQASK